MTGSISRRSIMIGGASAVVALSAKYPARAQSKTVNWMAFGSYNKTEVRAGFEKEFGISVNPVLVTSNSDTYLKLKNTGGQQVDVAMADGYWPNQMYADKLIEPLDMGQLSSSQSLLPEFRTYKKWTTESGRLMEFPLFWSPVGIGYVKDKVPAPTSWEAIFDHKYKGRVLWYAQDYAFGAMALLNGIKEPFDLTPSQIQDVKRKLIAAKPVVRGIPTTFNDVVRALVSGEADIAVLGSRGLGLRVMEAGGPQIGFAIPKEGTFGWIDGNMMVKGAANQAAGMKWIDYFHRPDNVYNIALTAKHSVCDGKVIEMLEKTPEGNKLVEFHNMRDLKVLDGMHLRKPPANLQAQLDAWNEVVAS